MIRLQRKRTKSAINANFRGDKLRKRLIDVMKAKRALLQSNSDGKLTFSSGKWKVTKKQLQQESNGKCAYCEASTTESMHGDVEHYRPKAIYWWLAYVYDNYLASCQLCNQKFKKAAFELMPAKAQMAEPAICADTSDDEIEALAQTLVPDPMDETKVAEFEQAHYDERPRILNPYIDDPSDYFAWKVSSIGEVDLVPNPGNPDAPAVVDAAERLLGLNRIELRERRYLVYAVYQFLVKAAENTGVPDALRQQAEKQIARDFADAKRPYSGMIRYFEAKRFLEKSSIGRF